MVLTGVAQGTSKPMNTPFNLSPIIQHVMPAVASIMVKRDTPWGQRLAEKMKETPTNPMFHTPQFAILGAAVVIDAKHGLLVTNAHVVDHAKEIIVSFKNHDRYIGKLIGKNDDFDIAMIQIKAKNLSEISIADSDNVQIGDFVVAIGNPFGLAQTVTSGIVSAVNRTESFGHGFQNLIQTDAPINLGNSGGPLINLNGQLIGINTAIYAASGRNPGSIGLGFAIPSSIVQSIVTQLKAYGNIKKGMLGVLAQNITPDLQHAFKLNTTKGCLITQVVKNSPAEKAGIRATDIILKIDHRPIFTAAQLRSITLLKRPGTNMTLTLWRNGKLKIINATIGNPETIQRKKHRLLDGLTMQAFSELEANGETIEGIGILNVQESSMAQLAGLLPGDIILSANNQPTPSIKKLTTIATKNNKILLEILRNKGKLFILMKK